LTAMWWAFGIVWLLILLLVVLIYVLLFGHSTYHKDGYVGRMHRYLNEDFGGDAIWLVQRVCGRKGSDVCKGLANYCIESRNPFLQIFYTSLFVAGLYIFINYMYARLPLHHKLGAFLIIPATFASFVIASVVDPGIVNKDTLPRYEQNYPYDGMLYYAKECRTCLVRRPARSKHCSICGHCTARYDHHCPWINNCVGARNLRWFLSFLGLTSFICFYGAYAVGWVFWYDVIIRFRLLDLRQGSAPLSWSLLLQYAVYQTGPPLVGLGLFLAMAGLAVLAFFLYHLYLLQKNTTSVESLKWSYANNIYKDQEPKRKEILEDIQSGGKGVRVAKVVVGGKDVSKLGEEKDNRRELRQRGGEPTAGPKAPQAPAAAEGEEEGGDEDAEFPLLREPINIYDRGILANFAEAIFPPCDRKITRTSPLPAVLERVHERDEKFKVFMQR